MATRIVYADPSSGGLYSTGTTGQYTQARAGTVTTTVAAASAARCGQAASAVCYEIFAAFDTSAIPSGATVSAAVYNPRLTTSFAGAASDTFEARARDWGSAVETSDWVPGADLSAL